MINCPFCGKLTDPKLANCPHCGVPLRTHTPRPRSAQPAAPVPGRTKPCPNCGAIINEGDIICVRCGTNLLTGAKVAGGAAPPKVQRDWSAYLPWGIAGVLAIIAIVGITALLVLFLRDPVSEARRLAQSGNLPEGINTLQAHVDEKPDDAEAQLLLGQLYWQSQQFQNAANAFDAASRLNPQNEQAGLAAAAAAAQLENEAGRNQQLAALRRVVEHHPGNDQARYLLALAIGETGDLSQQTEHLTQVAAASTSGEAQQFLGVSEALAGNLEKAEQDLEQAIAREANADGAAALGFISSMQGNDDKAEIRLQEAVTGGTRVAALARARLGVLRLSEGDAEGALPLLRDAATAPDAPASVRFFYALALEQADLPTEALTAYDSLVTGKTGFAQEAAVQMAQMYLQQDNLIKAEETLNRITGEGAASAKLYTLRGQLQAKNGNFPEAQQSFRMALQTEADYAPARLENGLLFIARGMLDDGLHELEEYLATVERQGGDPGEVELLVTQLRETVDVAGGEAPGQNTVIEAPEAVAAPPPSQTEPVDGAVPADAIEEEIVTL